MKNAPQAFRDDVLGNMPWSDDDDGWVATTSGETFQIVVGGTEIPDARLLMAARELSADPAALLARVASLLSAFAKSVPEAASEVLALRIEAVQLVSPDRPGDGMIYFTGPDPYRVWRCDYIAGVPKDLGFDD